MFLCVFCLLGVLVRLAVAVTSDHITSGGSDNLQTWGPSAKVEHRRREDQLAARCGERCPLSTGGWA